MAIAQTSHGKQQLSLEVRRTFAAPREKVFASWADPQQVAQWMYKDVSSHEIFHRVNDIRTGGRYEVEIRDAKKNETYWGHGVYREVTPPEKIVFSWNWTMGMLDGTQLHPDSQETQVTVEFFARGNSTEVVLTHAFFGSEKDRKEHDGGWNGCFDVLERFLQSSGLAR
jgi:uncharacterized protein YndB with AHSA1/START domain